MVASGVNHVGFNLCWFICFVLFEYGVYFSWHISFIRNLLMTKDNIETRCQYRDAYFGSVGIAMIDLELIDFGTQNFGFDDMIDARKLMDEKIPLWK